MTTPPTDLGPLTSYQLRLPSFEGPLDVLLRLIERSQLAIADVSLVAVTDQFLRHVETLGGAPPEAIAEFAGVGARLVLLKSRSLLPRPPEPEEGEESGDLVRQLVEYRTVKAAAQQLGSLDASGQGAFAPSSNGVILPAPISPPRLAAQPAAVLARALRRRLTLVPVPPEAVAVHRVVSLPEMVERVIGALTSSQGLRFSTVAAGCNGRHEVLTVFLAVLVLVRRRVVDAEQERLFGDIALRKAEIRAHQEAAAD